MIGVILEFKTLNCFTLYINCVIMLTVAKLNVAIMSIMLKSDKRLAAIMLKIVPP